ncbi:T6SS effector BTH_I2691 family protein [Vreelandella sulfidaeris]
MANTDAQAQARDSQFDETSFGTGMCPLLIDVALFPVRYAIDEAPAEAGASAPHPIAGQAPDYPDIETRSYTIRQLRDGWLYVWVEEEGEQRLDEYRVEGATFSGAPHLTYSTHASIALAYSSVQWTDRIREYMLENTDARQRLMRPVNLMAALNATANGTSFSAHAGPLTQLAEHVADITPNGAIDGFTTTTVSTVEREIDSENSEGDGGGESAYELLAVKPEITQDSVLATVEHHDEALFVALDDDLGIVNDLTMALMGRQAELEAFNDEYGHPLEVAQVAQTLCGPDDSDLPQAIRDDPELRIQAKELLQQRLEAQQAQEMSNAVNRGSPFGQQGSTLQRHHEERLETIDSNLEALGIEPPSSDDMEAWKGKRQWRDDVRYDEAVDFIATYQPRLERLQQHVDSILEDTLTWLERLPFEGEAIGYDPCDQPQSQQLMDLCAFCIESVGASEKGREWLTRTFRERDTLIGTSFYNFSPTLAQALDQVALQWLIAGDPDDQGEGVEMGDLLNVGNVAVNLGTVLGYEHVQQSKVFQALAPHIRDTFEVLKQAAAGAGKASWQIIAYHALPAAGAGSQIAAQQLARNLSITMVVAFVHPDNDGLYLERHDAARAQHRRWWRDMQRLSQSISRLTRRLSLPMSPGGRASIHRDITQLEQEQRSLALNEPKRFTLGGGTQANAAVLADLGFGELREQHRQRLGRTAANVAAARQRMERWINARGIGGLPLLIAAVNLVNVTNTMLSAQKDGVDREEMTTLASQGSYATAAVMSLWVLPYWQQHANQTASLFGNTTKITAAGIAKWNKANQAHIGRLAAKLASRVAGLAAFAAIGAGIESWQIWQQFNSSTADDERQALLAKLTMTGTMAGVGIVQLGGALLGRWVAFGWIMAAWAGWAMLVLSIGYLLFSGLAEHYRREGVRLWLYQSTWGNGNKWSGSDDDNNAELRALNEALLEPSLKLTAVTTLGAEFDSSRTMSPYSPGRRVPIIQGYWVQLALPASLSGETITISERLAAGAWAHSDSVQTSPSSEVPQQLPESVSYSADDPLRVWQAWLSVDQLPEGQAFLVEVVYDEVIYSDSQGVLRFPFYKKEPSQGDGVVETDKRYQYADSSESLSLTLPTA